MYRIVRIAGKFIPKITLIIAATTFLYPADCIPFEIQSLKGSLRSTATANAVADLVREFNSESSHAKRTRIAVRNAEAMYGLGRLDKALLWIEIGLDNLGQSDDENLPVKAILDAQYLKEQILRELRAAESSKEIPKVMPAAVNAREVFYAVSAAA